MDDFVFRSYDDLEDSEELNYPDFYIAWNEALEEGHNPGFLDVDTSIQLLDIYYEEDDKYGLKESIPYILNFHPNNIELVDEILFYLYELEEWIELYRFTEKFMNLKETAYPKIYHLASMFHLGMEEEAFLSFLQLKKEYKNELDNLSLAYLIMGNSLNEIQHYEAAIQISEEAIKNLGKKAEFYWIQFAAYIFLEDKEKATLIAEIIEKISPLDKNSWIELGKGYIELKKYDKAMEAFEFAITLGSKKMDIFMNLSRLYEANGNDLKALELVKSAIEIKPDFVEALLLACSIATKLKMFDEAFSYINKALQIEPEIKDMLFLYKSDIFFELGEYKKALLTLEEGIRETGDIRGILETQITNIRKQFPDI